MATAGRSELGTRVVAGTVLAGAAVLAVAAGGVLFALFVAGMVALVLWEWGMMHEIPVPDRAAGIIALLLVTLLGAIGMWREAFFALALALAVIAAGRLMGVARRGRNASWLGVGLLYAGLPALALLWLRGNPDGLALVLWTMGVVWATDILAYFTGRAVGGPKLLPAVSPKKTWAGLLGGMAGAAATSVAVASWFAWTTSPFVLAILGALLAIVAQAGDFLESWLKRRAGVKDSGALIPGHGGVMDRVDGLLPVACAVAVGLTLA
ncbi:MAG: phosphatidate cytidylyltransferase [Sphingomonadaceae bacterium]